MQRRRLGSLGAAALLTALGGGAGAAVPQGATYVALGSSYAAGPGITTLAPDSPGRCGQSADNYPRQLAARLKLKLIDRSCGGATTADILGTGPLGLPAQIEGVTADARLVTVTIGGNDVRYMVGFGVAVCRAHPDPAHLQAGKPCADPPGFDLNQAFAATETSLKAIAVQVRQRAPKARLVFVDYVTVLPATGTCASVAISAPDADELRARADRLARLTAQIAAGAHADIVKASRLTTGHDACAPDAWVEGLVQGQTPAGRARVSFHPTLPAMTAIAGALEQTLAK
jgi:lysophospholipase L1-like esterase